MKTLGPILIVLSTLWLAGCADTASCSEGYELTGGVCVKSSGGGPGQDGGPGDGGDGDDGGELDAATPGAMFGDACSDGDNHSDCGGEAPYCAVQPGQDEGVCTISGCADDASLCPSEWSCLDLSAFGAPSICVEGA